MHNLSTENGPRTNGKKTEKINEDNESVHSAKDDIHRQKTALTAAVNKFCCPSFAQQEQPVVRAPKGRES
jgi:hypothetical protein